MPLDPQVWSPQSNSCDTGPKVTRVLALLMVHHPLVHHPLAQDTVLWDPTLQDLLAHPMVMAPGTLILTITTALGTLVLTITMAPGTLVLTITMVHIIEK
ncbi:hypothetical protein ACRRTK_013913 [Alexandromys fortis]